MRRDITYSCDTCSKLYTTSINEKGLDVLGRCIITPGCSGKLHPVGLYERDKFERTEPSSALVPILYTHYQEIPAATWRITHGLNGSPSVQIFRTPQTITNIKDSNLTESQYTELTAESITYIDPNTIDINLPMSEGAIRGVAQCILRSSTLDVSQAIQAGSDSISQQISIDGHVTVCIPYSGTTPPADVSINLISISTDAAISNHNIPISSGGFGPWETIDTVFIQRKMYGVYSFSIPINLRMSGMGIVVRRVSQPETSIPILLSTPPYSELSDVIVDKFISSSNISIDNALSVTSVAQEWVATSESIIQPLFPHITTI